MGDPHASYGGDPAEHDDEDHRLLPRFAACNGDYHDDYQPHAGGGGDVDCSLRLGPPGAGVAVDAGAGASAVPGVEVGPMQRIGAAPPVPLGCSSHPHQTSFPATSELCTMCATRRTPLWRSGPLGPKSLCNACGIRYKKEEKRLALTLGFSSSSHTQSKSRRQNQ